MCIYINNVKKTNDIKSIKLYGTYKITPRFIEDIEKITKTHTYIYSNPELIPIKLLI